MTMNIQEYLNLVEKRERETPQNIKDAIRHAAAEQNARYDCGDWGSDYGQDEDDGKP